MSGPDTAATAVVDERDVARAAVALMVARDDEPARETSLLTGPEVLGRGEQVARLGAALGRQLRFRALPAGLARSRMLADGRPGPPVEALIAARERRPESTLITDHVERVTGRPPGSFAKWAVDRAGEFG